MMLSQRYYFPCSAAIDHNDLVPNRNDKPSFLPIKIKISGSQCVAFLYTSIYYSTDCKVGHIFCNNSMAINGLEYVLLVMQHFSKCFMRFEKDTPWCCQHQQVYDPVLTYYVIFMGKLLGHQWEWYFTLVRVSWFLQMGKKLLFIFA